MKLIDRIFFRLWPDKLNGDKGYHDYTLEIICLAGLGVMAIGSGQEVGSVGLIGIGVGIMLGGLLNHRLERNKERGWSYRWVR